MQASKCFDFLHSSPSFACRITILLSLERKGLPRKFAFLYFLLNKVLYLLYIYLCVLRCFFRLMAVISSSILVLFRKSEMDSTAEANQNKTKQTNIISNNNKHHIKTTVHKKGRYSLQMLLLYRASAGYSLDRPL